MRDVVDETMALHSENSFFNARLLIIDDDIGFIKILGSMLGEYPNQYFADSGLEGLRLAREIVPDLILLDFEMPGLGGADLGMILKSDPALAAVPVIFITSHREVSVVTATFQAGGKEFITKPVSRSILLDRVRAQLLQERDSEHRARLDDSPTEIL
ncbi:MAG: cheB [Sphingomonas bacterium]|uniref:response regulator n=1 Tax=Sphingomonas bacterium TaxID=1895847 RepID=UPI0026303779|nr:response regulator [Sphingomonas bacterium]MDB5707252.1 cheB [Sphingomonas bacterium]